MLVEYQPAHAEQPRLQAGRDDRLDQRLPRLHVVARDRRAGPRGELEHRGNVRGQIRRRVGERNPLAQRRVRVHHARRNRVVALLEPLLERRDRRMHRRLLHVDLGAAGPHHDETIAAVPSP